MNRDVAIHIATSYGLDSRGSIPSKGKRFLFPLHSIQTGSEAHPYTMGIGCSFPRVKRLGREAYHSPPPSTKLKAIPPLLHTS
jgi:hypothetical protein